MKINDLKLMMLLLLILMELYKLLIDYQIYFLLKLVKKKRLLFRIIFFLKGI